RPHSPTRRSSDLEFGPETVGAHKAPLAPRTDRLDKNLPQGAHELFTLLLLAGPWCMLWRRGEGCSGSAGQPPPLQINPLVPPALLRHHLADQLDVLAELLERGRLFQVPPNLQEAWPQGRLVGLVERPLVGQRQKDVAAEQGVVGGYHLGQA